MRAGTELSPTGPSPTLCVSPVLSRLLQIWSVFSFPFESFVFWTLVAAVIIPAVKGMGGNFLLFYPAISTGVDIPSPSCGWLWFWKSWSLEAAIPLLGLEEWLEASVRAPGSKVRIQALTK